MISTYYRNRNRSQNLSNVALSAFYRNPKSNRSRIGQCEQAVIPEVFLSNLPNMSDLISAFHRLDSHICLSFVKH